MDPSEDVFDSVTWETPTSNHNANQNSGYEVETSDFGGGLGGGGTPKPGFRHLAPDDDDDNEDPARPRWEGYLIISVKEPIKELDGTKDMYVSYRVAGKTNLPVFSSTEPSSRRRFQDFVFLREHLSKDFPACVVPPLPDKHRLEYLTGDRFSSEFIERRRQDLERFMQRLANHPTLQRATLLRDFLESTEWNVKMHQHIAHPPGLEPAPTMLDSISDTLLNAFAKVRKPDERFMEMRESIDKFEESLTGIERIWARARSRTNDLTTDYHDLAVAVQGLGYLETGITDPLNHFSNTLMEFSALLRHTVRPNLSIPPVPSREGLRRRSFNVNLFSLLMLRSSPPSNGSARTGSGSSAQTQASTDPFLTHLQSLLAYSQAHKAVLKLRDQKQLDFEELTDYLGNVTSERDRLAALVSGQVVSSGLGIGAYLRDRVEALRGGDDDRSRVEKMKKLDGRIKELQDAVTTAHETCDAFNGETMKENAIFQYAKETEMKELLSNMADGQIEMYRAAMEEWDRIIPILGRIRVEV